MEVDLEELLENTFISVRYMVANDCAIAQATYFDPEVMFDVATATGSSKRVPGDKFDKEVGIQYAVGRAIENLGIKIKRRGVGKSLHNDQNQAIKNDPVVQAYKEHRKQQWILGQDALIDLGLPADAFVEAVSEGAKIAKKKKQKASK